MSALSFALVLTLSASEHVYSSSEYGFSIRYPDSLVILDEPAVPSESRPRLLHRVRFQEKAIAKTEFAELEPPRFSIAVFAVPQGTLREWLHAHGRVPGRAVVSEVKREGAKEGLRVQDPRLLAPNEFFYYLTSRYVIQVTPLGSEGAGMLDSLRSIVERAALAFLDSAPALLTSEQVAKRTPVQLLNRVSKILVAVLLEKKQVCTAQLESCKWNYGYEVHVFAVGLGGLMGQDSDVARLLPNCPALMNDSRLAFVICSAATKCRPLTRTQPRAHAEVSR